MESRISTKMKPWFFPFVHHARPFPDQCPTPAMLMKLLPKRVFTDDNVLGICLYEISDMEVDLGVF